MTLNSLVVAANQTTNRDPVMETSSKEVEDALDELRAGKLATLVLMAGARVPKYRHLLLDVYDLQPPEVALLCTLLLRGPQTAGELNARSERLHPFGSLAEVEEQLQTLGSGENPLVRQLPARPGQKGARWVELLSGEPALEDAPALPGEPAPPSRIEQLQERVERLETGLTELRAAFDSFRRQFEG